MFSLELGKKWSKPLYIPVTKINGGIYILESDLRSAEVWEDIETLYKAHQFTRVVVGSTIYWIPKKLVPYFYNNNEGEESYFFEKLVKDKVYYDILTTDLIPYSVSEGNINLNAKYIYWIIDNKWTRMDKGDIITDNKGVIIPPITSDMISYIKLQDNNNIKQNQFGKEYILIDKELLTEIVNGIKEIQQTLATKPAIQGSPLDAAYSSKPSQLQSKLDKYSSDVDELNKNYDDYVNNEEDGYTVLVNNILSSLRKK
jgi:hypothetical protein